VPGALGDALEEHDGSGFVEGSPWCQHRFDERGLGSGEHVADLSLLLHGIAQGAFDGLPVEVGHLLKFIQRDREPKSAVLRDLGGQAEHLLGVRGVVGVACGESKGRVAGARIELQFGLEAVEKAGDPVPDLLVAPGSPDDGAGEPLEKLGVVGVAPHGHDRGADVSLL
jgi:hypothetical protein